jgi:hypothetical protein
MPCVAQKLQLVSMKAVAVVGQQMDERNGRGNCQQYHVVAAPRAMACILIAFD